MENEIIEYKTCIAVYQKKYSEIVNLNIGLESKLMFFSEKIKELEKIIENQQAKLEGTSVEKIIIQNHQDVISKHIDVTQKVINIENRISYLMKLDERMCDLEGAITHMRDAAEDLIKIKEKIVPPLLPQSTEEKIALPKSNGGKKKKPIVTSHEKIMDVKTPKDLEFFTVKIDAEDSTIAEDGGEF